MKLNAIQTNITFGTNILDIEVPEHLTRKFKTGLSFVDGAMGGQPAAGDRHRQSAKAGHHLVNNKQNVMCPADSLPSSKYKEDLRRAAIAPSFSLICLLLLH